MVGNSQGGASTHRLRGNERNAAFRSHIVYVDMENCRPAQLLKTLRETQGSDGRSKGSVERSYPVLAKYVIYYRGGRYFCESTTASGTKRRKKRSTEYLRRRIPRRIHSIPTQPAMRGYGGRGIPNITQATRRDKRILRGDQAPASRPSRSHP